MSPKEPAPRPYLHSAEVRAAAISRVSAGESLSSVSRALDVPYTTIKRWAVAAGAFTPATPVQRVDYGQRLGELIALELDAAIATARLFGDREWLAKQNAHDIAVAAGIRYDKLLRVFAAIQSGDTPAGPHGDDEGALLLPEPEPEPGTGGV